MWQYTTETIINSNVGKLKQIDSATNKLLTGKTDADLVRFYKDTKGIIYIEGVGRFDAANIKGAWKRPYQKAEKAKGKRSKKNYEEE